MDHSTRTSLRIFAGIVFYLISSSSIAFDIEKLLMPGPVASAHEELESQCTSCHVRFKKIDQSALCLDCHEEIQSDISKNKGFHGKSDEVADNVCATCHTDHKGRDADIVEFNPQEFNHDFTDFGLKGGHVQVDCVDCHQPEIAFRDTPVDCVGCHTADDPHNNFLGEDCVSCHAESDWLDVEFDHETTDFALSGGHATAECLDCHVDQTFQNTPSDCYSCHEADNPHESFLGTQCNDCHTGVNWDATGFDHDATNFTLAGEHAVIECSACHEDQSYQNAPVDCYSCHKADDVHEGRSGTDCATCHSEENWQDTSFNHERDTNFRIDGAHKKLACDDCHSPDPFNDALDMSCNSCHLEDDTHDGVNGTDCESCHTTQNWETTSFDHDTQTDFMIRGKHQTLDCDACHVDPVFEVKLGGACIDCHLEDDPHKGQLGKECSNCHNEEDWSEVVEFDHDFSRFPLLGKHIELQCNECHESTAFQEAPIDCYSCHRDNDDHEGRFGQDCASCHNPLAWNIWFFDHSIQTEFPLEGAHDGLTCESCHRRSGETTMRIPQSCDSCHLQDDIHDGEFGARCDKCHSSQSFSDLKEIH